MSRSVSVAWFLLRFLRSMDFQSFKEIDNWSSRITDEGVSLVKDNGIERCRRSRNVSKDAFQLCKHPKNLLDGGMEGVRRPRNVDGIERVGRSRNVSDAGMGRVRRPRNSSDAGMERVRRSSNVDGIERVRSPRNVSDASIERCAVPKNVSSHKLLGVRMEGGAMRCCRRNLELARSERQREAASSRSANRKHPYSRPSHLEQYRGQCIRNHRPNHLSRELNSENVNGRSRGRSRNRNRQDI